MEEWWDYLANLFRNSKIVTYSHEYTKQSNWKIHPEVKSQTNLNPSKEPEGRNQTAKIESGQWIVNMPLLFIQEMATILYYYLFGAY